MNVAAVVSAKPATDLQTELKTVVTSMTTLAVRGDHSGIVLMYKPPEESAQVPEEEKPAFLQRMQQLMRSPRSQQKLHSQNETVQSTQWENGPVNEIGNEATFALPNGSSYGDHIFFTKANGGWCIK